MLPEGWETTTLAELSRVERGRFSVRPRNDPRYYGGPYPFVQTGDVAKAGTYLHNYSQTLNEDGLAVSKLFPAGSILLTIAANIGEVAITCFPVACPDSIVGITPKPDRAELVWLVHYLEMQKETLDRNAPKMAQKNINLEVLKPLLIRTPPLPEQKKIAEILSTWDKGIATEEMLLANAEEQKRALMHDLLTGQKRLKGFSAEWKRVRFSEIFARVGRKNALANTNVLTISGKDGLISQRKYFNKQVAAVDTSGYTLLKAGEFAYNKSYSIGYPLGAIKMLPWGEEGILSSLYICFSIKSSRASSHDFYRHWFEFGGLDQQIYGIAQEGARNHGLLNVSITEFFDLHFEQPEFDEQVAIAKVINVAEEGERLARAALEKLRSEKRALMHDLLMGRRRVTM